MLGIAQRVNASRMNTSPGAEFRAALTAAHRNEADVLFADRPSYITGKRIWRSISFSEACSAAWVFFQSVRQQSREQKQKGQNVLTAMDEVMQDDGVSHLRNSLIPRLRATSPTISKIWLDERDQFMAAGLQQILESEGGRMKNVVAIVGEAHVQGVAENLSKGFSTPERKIDSLLEIPEPSFNSSVVMPSFLVLTPLAAVALPVFGVWKVAWWAGPKLARLIHG